MCGRTSVTIDPVELSSRFDVSLTETAEAYLPKYNVDPSDGLLTVTNEDTETADVLDWGFVPEWADNPADVPHPINARQEKLESGMYRSAFEHKRCLVIADGFYEWQGPKGRKQPYRIVREDRDPFAFAGIWSRYEPDAAAGPRESVAIITTEPNEVVAEIHDRMPVLLEPDEEQSWLAGDLDTAKDVLNPFPASKLTAFPVSKRVNDPDREGPELFEEIDIGEQSGLDDFAG